MDPIPILDILLNVDKTLGTLIANYGVQVYAVLGAIIFAETGLVVMPFLPGDSLLFVSGAFCATGSMNLGLLIALLIVCGILGNTTNYLIGRMIGQKVFTKNYRFIDRKSLENTHVFFEKHGGKTVILARFIPIVRTFAPFVAGVSEMSFARFQFFNITGGILWVSTLVTAGYFFGNIPIIRDHLNTIVIIGVGSALLPILIGAAWKFFKSFTTKHEK